MKTLLALRLAGLVLAMTAAAFSATAGSLAASSAAGGSSASSASSASSGKSSDSSSKNNKVAEGPYRIVDVAALAARPDMLRVTLQPLTAPAGQRALVLVLPRQPFDRTGLAVGQNVAARQRPYGTEFAVAETHKPFFLLMNDDWFHELAANPVVL